MKLQTIIKEICKIAERLYGIVFSTNSFKDLITIRESISQPF